MNKQRVYSTHVKSLLGKVVDAWGHEGCVSLDGRLALEAIYCKLNYFLIVDKRIQSNLRRYGKYIKLHPVESDKIQVVLRELALDAETYYYCAHFIIKVVYGTLKKELSIDGKADHVPIFEHVKLVRNELMEHSYDRGTTTEQRQSIFSFNKSYGVCIKPRAQEKLYGNKIKSSSYNSVRLVFLQELKSKLI